MSKFKYVNRYMRYAMTAFAAIAIASCGFNDDEEDEPDPVPGDPFPDVEESYLLSPETESATTLPGDGSIENPFLIRNAMELKLFTELVNNGGFRRNEEDITASTFVNLTHDIEIADDYSWTPIGSCANPFDGVFNGQGHCISGTLRITSVPEEARPTPETGIVWSTNKAGFFGYADGAEISQIRLSADVYLPTMSSYDYCGSLVALANNTSIHHVTYEGTMIVPVAKSIPPAQLHLGGIAGYTITGYFYDNDMNGHMRFGTDNLPSKKIIALQSNIGGLIGTERSTTITKCNNSADISIDAGNAFRLRVGGIAGYRMADGNVPNYELLTLVMNEGDITIGKILETRVDGQSPMAYIGGIYGDGGEDNGEYCNNINSGDITVGETRITSYVGGIAGMAYKYSVNGAVNTGRISNSASKGCTGGCYGCVIGDIRNLGNSGEVISRIKSGTEESGVDSGWTGGIAGYSSGAITRCNNEGDVTSGKDREWNGVPVSLAGAIAGSAAGTIALDNTNYGTVNGHEASSPSDPTIFVGETWLAWEMILDGTLTPTSNKPAFTHFFDKISRTCPFYQWPIY